MQFNQVFALIPPELRKELKADYHEIKHNFALRKFKPSEMGGGHFCETVYRILEWHTNPNGSYTLFGSGGGDFRKLQSRLMQLKPKPHESVRFHIPTALCQIYDIRSKRGPAHKSKDVSPNFMDAMLVVAAADWVMAELVRMLHNIDIDEARNVVESIITKKVPIIWQIGDRRRILDPSLTEKQAVLALLYFDHPKPILKHELIEWVESCNPSRLRTQHLPALHRSRLIDLEETTGLVRLSPRGVAHVEAKIPLEIIFP